MPEMNFLFGSLFRCEKLLKCVCCSVERPAGSLRSRPRLNPRRSNQGRPTRTLPENHAADEPSPNLSQSLHHWSLPISRFDRNKPARSSQNPIRSFLWAPKVGVISVGKTPGRNARARTQIVSTQALMRGLGIFIFSTGIVPASNMPMTKKRDCPPTDRLPHWNTRKQSNVGSPNRSTACKIKENCDADQWSIQMQYFSKDLPMTFMAFLTIGRLLAPERQYWRLLSRMSF